MCNKDGNQEYSGAFISTEIVKIPDGSTIELFDDEENYYTRALELSTPFTQGVAVLKHALISYDGELYKVIQAHTTQSDWPPDIVPALFLKIQQPGESGYPEWLQPTGLHDSYSIGDKVIHNDHVWECVQGDAEGHNVWEPGVFGWTDLGEY